MIRSNNYWQNKVSAWLNKYSKDVYPVLTGLNSNVDEELLSVSSNIASGLTRAVLPSDIKIENNVLKHPLVKDKSIKLDIKSVDLNDFSEGMKNQIETDLSWLTRDCSSQEEEAKKIFNYIFFAFNKQLRKNNVGNLGAFWDVFPADTRLPDHSMWHHFGLTSAIYSSLEINDDKSKGDLSLVVYSITPVQEFIGKARKLRDYWTGSVLLSYLAFVGITKVCEELGPDHILYPSLQNQALMETWLSKNDEELGKCLLEVNSVLKTLDEESKSIASFPNKFVFICNNKDVKTICEEIEKKIAGEWKSTSNIVKEYIERKAEAKGNKRLSEIWNNSIDKYWKYSWAATNFATINDKTELSSLLPEIKWKNELQTVDIFAKESKSNIDFSNLYGTTHSLVQGLLAAGKNKPIFANVHHSQKGEKCPLCGESEILNTFDIEAANDESKKAKNYSNNVKEFWGKLRKKENSDDDNFSQIGENERLCAVCSLKRFLPNALNKKYENHILYSTLRVPYEKENFPSTTEMSAWEFLQNFKENDQKKIANNLHENEFLNEEDFISLIDSKIKDENKEIFKDLKKYETKYYAFLLMDGDKMGDLINGETTEATWENVLNFDMKSDSPFMKEIDGKKLKDVKRTINPAVHSMISDSLNNFARYGVQPCVRNGKGKLIYAGGDDVCAILPLSKAFEVADKIRQIYQLSYAEVTKDGSVALCSDEQNANKAIEPKSNMAKIVTHLGHTDNQDKTKISLSGAIIIAHHKTPLKEIISDAHKVLDGVAKDKSGRNSLAIRLKKRSGGDRDTWFKWEEKNIFDESENKKTCRESFLNVIENAKKKDLSSSLLYKLEMLKGSLEPLLFKDEKPVEITETSKKLILKLFEYEAAHSGFKNNAKEMAVDLAGICIKVKKDDEGKLKVSSDKDWYNFESAIIANFMAKKKSKEEI